jgi:hypothetical protein
MRLPIVYIVLVLVGCLSSACTSPREHVENKQQPQVEELKITAGTPMAIVEEILAKCDFQYGSQFTLQWAPLEGRRILFCRLDKDATLAVTYDAETEKVLYLSVDCTAIRSKFDAAILRPLSITFAPKGYSLTFGKEERGQPAARANAHGR